MGLGYYRLKCGAYYRYVGLKLNYGAYVGQLTWDFILGEEGYEFYFYSGV